jgi:hypothetical protein
MRQNHKPLVPDHVPSASGGAVLALTKKEPGTLSSRQRHVLEVEDRESDPGMMRPPGGRFFYGQNELEPLKEVLP